MVQGSWVTNRTLMRVSAPLNTINDGILNEKGVMIHKQTVSPETILSSSHDDVQQKTNPGSMRGNFVLEYSQEIIP